MIIEIYLHYHYHSNRGGKCVRRRINDEDDDVMTIDSSVGKQNSSLAVEVVGNIIFNC